MKSFRHFLRISGLVLSAVAAAVCLFLSITSISLNQTVLKPEFHKELYRENKIYDSTYTILQSSIAGFMTDMEKNSPQSYQQTASIFHQLQESLSYDLVQYNMDQLTDQMFQYFNGSRMFLPDISLSAPEQISKPVDSDTGIQAQLNKIQKVNLSAILLYTNRSDIRDYILQIKLLFYLIDHLPLISLGLLLVLVLGSLLLIRKPFNMARWIAAFLLASAIFCIAMGGGVLLYHKYLLPQNLFMLSSIFPLNAEKISQYLLRCILPQSIVTLVSGAVMLFLALTVYILLPVIVRSIHKLGGTTRKNRKTMKSLRITQGTLFIASLAFIVIFTMQVFSQLDQGDYALAIDRLRNVSAVTQIVHAKDDTIYTLQVKLVDKKSGTPLQNIRMDVEGTSTESSHGLNASSRTDTAGVGQFSLGKGHFRVDFIPEDFPEEYQTPAPLFLDLKAAGTTMVTVKVEQAQKVESWGITEIEVLNAENHPVSGIEVEAAGWTESSEMPDRLLSVTNEKGIAVFHMHPGKYTFQFSKDTFPTAYTLPGKMEFGVTVDTVTRYSIQLVPQTSPSEASLDNP